LGLISAEAKVHNAGNKTLSYKRETPNEYITALVPRDEIDQYQWCMQGAQESSS
jgi:hypothetical protein